MRIFWDLWWFFKMERVRYGLGVGVLLAVAVLMMFPPYVVRVLVDAIADGTLTAGLLTRWLLLLAGCGIVLYALRYTWRVMIFGSAVRLGQLLRNRLYEHFTRMSPRFFQQRRTGDLMAHATNDIQAVEMTAGEGVLTLVDSISIGGMVIFSMAAFISWKLTLIALLPMPIMAWATSKYGTILHQRFHEAQQAFSDLNGKVQENVSGVRVVKAFGREDAELEAFRRLAAEVAGKNIGVARVDALFDPTIKLIVGICFFLSVSFGAKFVVDGSITLGGLAQFAIYLGLLIWPMLAVGWLFNIVERGRASYERIQTLLGTPADIADREGALTESPAGDLELAIESFAYPDQPVPALQRIELTIRRGQTLGIVGKLGSGKTTLLRLLLREFEVPRGAISIGGTPIADVTLDALRRAVGCVPQEHVLFSATVAENIAFGRPEATQAEIEAAARLAAVHDDIVRLPGGYETVVGERGVTLSGGQKQRISIARALLQDPDILLLDDCLSAVDARTEREILEALRNGRHNKTTLITAHRLSAVEHADLIIVLEDGRIAERGTHDELLRLGGWYADMYRRQQLESLVEQGGTAYGASQAD